MLMLLAAKVIAISGHAGAYALMSLADATTRTRASFPLPRQLLTELLPQTGAKCGALILVQLKTLLKAPSARLDVSTTSDYARQTKGTHCF